MAKKLKKALPPKLTKSQQEAIGLTIAARTEKGMNAFVVAGAEVLRSRYGWNEEQSSAWATETVQLGAKYLKLDSEDNGDGDTRGNAGDGVNDTRETEPNRKRD